MNLKSSEIDQLQQEREKNKASHFYLKIKMLL